MKKKFKSISNNLKLSTGASLSFSYPESIGKAELTLLKEFLTNADLTQVSK